MFKNKILLITSGADSFGNAELKRLIDSDLKEICIFSRDEKKQDEMRKKFNWYFILRFMKIIYPKIRL